MSMESRSTKSRRRKPPDVFPHLLTRAPMLSIFFLSTSLYSKRLLTIWAKFVYTEMSPVQKAIMVDHAPGFAMGLAVASLILGGAAICIYLYQKQYLGNWGLAILLTLGALVDFWHMDSRFIRTVDIEEYFRRDGSICFLQTQEGKFRTLAARGGSTFSELRWYPRVEAAKGSLSWVFRAKQPESVRTGP